MSEPKKAQQIKIQVTDKVADGEYANLAIVTHSAAEFVMDFVRVMPGTPKANVQARVIMTPSHVKAFYHALQHNIEKFETQHGEIRMTDPSHLPGIKMDGSLPN
jgi:hypothetical protein